MKKLIFAFFLAALCNAGIAEEKSLEKIIESSWISSSELDRFLQKKIDSRFMPFKVIGKKNDKELISYKGFFKPFPPNTDHFFAYWGMTGEWYRKRQDALKSEGFQEIWHQSFQDAAGTEIHQAVWFKASASEPEVFPNGVLYKDEEHEKNILIGMLAKAQYKTLQQSLENTYSAYREGKLSSHVLVGRFDAIANLDADFDKRFDDWVRTTPGGYSYLARGMHLQQRAWDARGSELANKTTKTQFAKLRHLATRARLDLLKANDLLNDCALCAGVLIENNRALSRDKSENAGLLQNALRQDPKMWRPVLLYFSGLYPQWGGSYAEMKAFIEEIRQRTADPALIDQLMSRMYWVHGSTVQKEDQEAALTWYEKGVNDHPYSLLINELALIYSKKNKHIKAAELLEKNLSVNDEWDIYTLEALAQAYFAMGQQLKGEKMIAKRNEAQRRYLNSE
jgi:tetratricopeptide (TPR) repeat protein